MATKITDIGNKREMNEDAVDFEINDKYGLYIICDGVGGHNAGEIASRESVKLVMNYIKEYFNKSIAPQILDSAIQKANKEILSLSRKNDSYKGMGTTITCALDTGNDVFIAHAGDSSAYRIKDNSIYKITRDHTLVQQLVDEGKLSKDDARVHPNKNVITRSLGSKGILKLDITELQRKDYDYIILCTDGLTDYIKMEEMLKVFKESKKDEEVFAKTLVEIAKQRGGKDNISLLIFGGDL